LRAGDSFAVREILLTLNAKPRSAVSIAKDTTNRTDKNGTTQRVPEWELMYAADSSLNSALRAGGTWRNRLVGKHTLPAAKKSGYLHRFQLRTDGRAGSTGCPMELRVGFYATPSIPRKAKET
jgi:hypothetical protein